MLPILLLLASPLPGPALDPPPLVRSHQDDRRAREERKEHREEHKAQREERREDRKAWRERERDRMDRERDHRRMEQERRDRERMDRERDRMARERDRHRMEQERRDRERMERERARMERERRAWELRRERERHWRWMDAHRHRHSCPPWMAPWWRPREKRYVAFIPGDPSRVYVYLDGRWMLRRITDPTWRVDLEGAYRLPAAPPPVAPPRLGIDLHVVLFD
jgi:hypothetical protein